MANSLREKKAKICRHFERMVSFRLGRLRKPEVIGPGLIFSLPCIDNLINVDLRLKNENILAVNVLTKDVASVSITGTCYYRVVDPVQAVLKIANYKHSIELLIAVEVRKVIANTNLSQVLVNRESITQEVLRNLSTAVESWGLKIEWVEIIEIELAAPLQKAMGAETEAKRIADATITAAESELKSSQSLLQAATEIGPNKSALQLRYMQELSKIPSINTKTYIFPLLNSIFAEIQQTTCQPQNKGSSLLTTVQPKDSFPPLNVEKKLKESRSFDRLTNLKVLLKEIHDRVVNIDESKEHDSQTQTVNAYDINNPRIESNASLEETQIADTLLSGLGLTAGMSGNSSMLAKLQDNLSDHEDPVIRMLPLQFRRSCEDIRKCKDVTEYLRKQQALLYSDQKFPVDRADTEGTYMSLVWDRLISSVLGERGIEVNSLLQTVECMDQQSEHVEDEVSVEIFATEHSETLSEIEDEESGDLNYIEHGCNLK